MLLNYPLLRHNFAKGFVGWNGKWKENEQYLGAKRRLGNSFERKKEGMAPQLLVLPCDFQYLHAKLGCYEGHRNP